MVDEDDLVLQRLYLSKFRFNLIDSTLQVIQVAELKTLGVQENLCEAFHKSGLQTLWRNASLSHCFITSRPPTYGIPKQ